MNKEQKIEYLKKFELLVNEWFDLRSGRDLGDLGHQKMLEMARLWGVVSEILKGLDYKMGKVQYLNLWIIKNV